MSQGRTPNEPESPPGLDGWDFILALDDELMLGGHILPEWALALTREADLSFVAGAPVAAILTAHAAVEAFLRGEGGQEHNSAGLIDESNLPDDLNPAYSPAIEGPILA